MFLASQAQNQYKITTFAVVAHQVSWPHWQEARWPAKMTVDAPALSLFPLHARPGLERLLPLPFSSVRRSAIHRHHRRPRPTPVPAAPFKPCPSTLQARFSTSASSGGTGRASPGRSRGWRARGPWRSRTQGPARASDRTPGARAQPCRTCRRGRRARC